MGNSLLKEGWSNLECHNFDISTTELTIGIDLIEDKYWDNEGCLDEEELSFLCNKYRPWCISPTPIVLQQVRSWMKQNWDRKTRQKGRCFVSLLIDRRLKVKLGTQRTLWRVNWAESCIVPTCVTVADSPFGNLTTQWEIEVIEVNMETEQTIWFEAPVSITQTWLSKAILFMTLAKKNWMLGIKHIMRQNVNTWQRCNGLRIKRNIVSHSNWILRFLR